MDVRSTTWRTDDLRQHAQWMQALACALVQDVATAEDLVQDTCVRALTRRPAQVRALRPWLRRVLLNLVWQHRRSETRRVAREQASGPLPETTAPDELSERIEAQRILGEEFPHLRDPYRTTLWLRYYEDVEPSEIARRMGIPAGTVRWRIQRGLELLRSRLDERHGGCRATWCSLLLGWTRANGRALTESTLASPSLPLIATTLAMNTALKGALALAVVLLAAVAFTELRDAEVLGETPVAVVFEPVPVLVTESEAPRSDALDQPDQRVAVLRDSARDESLAAAADTRILARFVDEIGQGIQEVTLREVVRRRFGPRTGLHVMSAKDGSAQLVFPEGRSGKRIMFDATAIGYIRHEVMVDVVAGETHDLGVVVLRHGGAVSGRVVNTEGRGLAGVVVRTEDAKLRRRSLDARRMWNAPGTFPDTTSDETGDFLLSGLEPGLVRLWVQVDQGLASYSKPIEVRAGQVSTGVTVVLEDPSEEHIVRGVVLDPDGSPVPNARLEYCFSAEEGSTSTQTKWALADGTFELFTIDDLEWWIRATDPDDRFAKVETAHYEDPPEELSISFSEARYLEFRAEDRAGRPVEVFGFRVFSLRPEHTGVDRRRMHVDETSRQWSGGRARFRTPTEEFFVEVDATGFDLSSLGPLRPAGIAEDLLVTLEEVLGLGGRVVSASGPVGGARVSLRRVVQGQSSVNGFRSLVEYGDIERVTSNETGAFMLTPRETGEFVVRAEAEGFVPTVWGPVRIEDEVGRTDIELVMGEGGGIAGRLMLPDGGHPASRTIGASRGDGKPLFTRTDVTGSYRFDGLTPGPWEVRFVEAPTPPGGVSIESSTGPLHAGIDWTCEVQEGGVTYFDIYPETESPPPACKLAGQLLFAEAGDWVAVLGPPEEHIVDRGDPVPLTAEGRFELAASLPGHYRLQLMNRASVQFVSDLVDLAEGVSTWSMDKRHGSLEVAGLEPSTDAEFPALVHLWRGTGELRVITCLLPDENGSCVVDDVPIGAGDLAVPDPNSLDPSTWEVVRKVTVHANETTSVSMD